MIESSRMQWEEARAQLESEGDTLRRAQLLDLVDAATGRLRRELGSVFSLSELDERYVDAELWIIELVRDRTPSEGGRVRLADTVLVTH